MFRQLFTSAAVYQKSRYFKYPKLGRWDIQHDERTIHLKVDQANLDHSSGSLNNFEKEYCDKKEKELIPYCT